MRAKLLGPIRTGAKAAVQIDLPSDRVACNNLATVKERQCSETSSFAP